MRFQPAHSGRRDQAPTCVLIENPHPPSNSRRHKEPPRDGIDDAGLVAEPTQLVIGVPEDVNRRRIVGHTRTW